MNSHHNNTTVIHMWNIKQVAQTKAGPVTSRWPYRYYTKSRGWMETHKVGSMSNVSVRRQRHYSGGVMSGVNKSVKKKKQKKTSTPYWLSHNRSFHLLCNHKSLPHIVAVIIPPLFQISLHVALHTLAEMIWTMVERLLLRGLISMHPNDNRPSFRIRSTQVCKILTI